MPEISKRSRQVAELIQHQIANLLKKEIHDPRLVNIVIIEVDLSADLKNAKIFYTSLQSDKNTLAEIKSALAKASGYLRHLLAKQVELRYIPQLHFIYDEKYIKSQHVQQLVDKAVAEDEARHVSKDEPSEHET